MDGSSQWQRDAFVTPADVEDVFWAIKTMVSPVTYPSPSPISRRPAPTMI